MRGLVLSSAMVAILVVACSDPSGPPSGVAAVASIEIVVRNDTLPAGDTATVRAIPRNTQGGEVAGVAVSLSSSDTAVVRFESGALARTRKAGTAVIVASAGSVSANLTLTDIVSSADGWAAAQPSLRSRSYAVGRNGTPDAGRRRESAPRRGRRVPSRRRRMR